MLPELIDTHAHLQSKEFDSDREEVLARARAAGVRDIVIVGAGDGWSSSEKALAMTGNDPHLWASVGIHPNSADAPLDKKRLLEMAKNPRVVAIGETGLDYYWSTEKVKEQKEWFRLHIEIACELKKPLIIHSRSSGTDCLEMVEQSPASEVGGVFHCYAENQAFAEKLAQLNFYVSFPGIVTFKNAEELRNVVRDIPLSQILLETDSPYLAPVPYRGKRCESAFMVETAKTIAQIKGVSLEELAQITCSNAKKLFKLN